MIVAVLAPDHSSSLLDSKFTFSMSFDLMLDIMVHPHIPDLRNPNLSATLEKEQGQGLIW